MSTYNFLFLLLIFEIFLFESSVSQLPDGEKCFYDYEEKFIDTFDFKNCRNFSAVYFCTLTPDKQCWLQSLYEEALRDATTTPRKRREIRMLSQKERNTFYKAVNDLKKDTTIKPNKYDALARIHTERTLCAVHKGSNFLGWHRIYLLLFETALRQKEKSVVLPYWNSVLDNNNVTEPNNTIIFTDKFLGNGKGVVSTGPFKGWVDATKCQLVRNISQIDTILPDPKIMDRIQYSDELIHAAQISYRAIETNGLPRTWTIESQHNQPHNWIGGMMSVLDTSPSDPVFFLHHSYFDYVWEKFRIKQKKNGIDPEKDYPGTANDSEDLVKFHTANRTMNCFFWMTNIEGYWNNITEKIYNYEDSPECPKCGNSPFLKCSTELKRCIGVDGEDKLETISNGPKSFPLRSMITMLLLSSLVIF